MEELHEECGVFGVFQHPQAAQLTYFGLHALQHRGQEGAGIAAADGQGIRCHKGKGLLTEAFRPGDLEPLAGSCAVGGDRGGSAVIHRHEDALTLFEISPDELRDVDTPMALAALRDTLA